MRNFTAVHRYDRSRGSSETLPPPWPATVWLSVIQSLFEGLSSLSDSCRDGLTGRREPPVNQW